ncbi:glycosyl transferase family 2 [Candidatus Gastranaerophilus sp. (ex Termes propinquus)]|nr:glycosyl transferase family 2 [Candidatus Gastranaerophilus sp. (ex Termes propinquus)]
MRWFEAKEQAAGRKRLLLTWWLYKRFGKNSVKLVAFCVTFFAFCFAGKARKYSREYLKIVGLNPCIVNQFKHFLSYSLSLVDKMEVFSGNYDFKKISFAKDEEKAQLYEDLSAKKGVFFICSHLGNTDIMRAFLSNNTSNTEVNVFLSEAHCKVFNDFIRKISTVDMVKTYAVEEIDPTVAFRLKDSLDKGGIAFMAGDRISPNNLDATLVAKLFDRDVLFPKGVFKLAQLMEVPIYFIAALKSQECYTIHLKRFEKSAEGQKVASQMCKEYATFLEQKTHLAPLQFYNFYNIFDQ